jgi:hypothetical protein
MAMCHKLLLKVLVQLVSVVSLVVTRTVAKTPLLLLQSLPLFALLMINDTMLIISHNTKPHYCCYLYHYHYCHCYRT